MKRLFAPWRNEYVTSGGQDASCPLCRALQDPESASLVVHLAELNLVVMNLYPYGSGHVMIAPRRHVSRLAEATPEELSEMMALARRLEDVLRDAYHPDGINMGMNLGKPAGAGVADHIHLHVVPRWIGDTNFMTVVGQTRVISEDPREGCARLRAYFP